MKGLLLKDFKLMMNQKNYFLMMVVIGLCMGAVYDPSFTISYLTFMGGNFVLSTISYDEFDNGYAFLFTLPITRHLYVYEKYIFSFLTSSSIWLISNVITISYELAQHHPIGLEWWITSFSVLVVLLSMSFLMIPFHLKYGGEKGRIVMMISFGAVFVALYFCSTLVELPNTVRQTMQNAPWLIAVVLLIIGLIVTFGALKSAIQIMNRKEF